MEFNVSVSSKKYTKEEADEKFNEKFEEQLIDILNENNDYEHINSKLNFRSDLGDGIKASYAFEPKIVVGADTLRPHATNSIVEATQSEPDAVEDTIHPLATVSEIATTSNASLEDFYYYVKYQNVIDGSGNVHNEDFKVSDYCTGYIIIQFSTREKWTDLNNDARRYHSDEHHLTSKNRKIG